MNALTIKGNWNIVKGKLKQKYAELTDEDLTYVEGQMDALLGRIQKRTGQNRQAIERFVRMIEETESRFESAHRKDAPDINGH